MKNHFPPDANARELALDVTQSFIVQAPAGSGKTELLTRRVLALLTTVKQPEEIVAITFTRKAAAEMRSRILTALRYAQQDEPDELYKKESWLLAKKAYERSEKLNWHLLHNPNRLRVTTIDAFCLGLVGQMPVLSRMGIQPGLIENPGKIYLSAIQHLFEKIDNRPERYAASLNKIFNFFHYDIDYLSQLFQNMLHHREQWLPYAINHRFEDRLQESLHGIIENALMLLKKEFEKQPDFNELLNIFNFASRNLSTGNADMIVDEWPTATVDDLIKWQAISQLCLTKEGCWRKKLTKNEGFPAESQFKNRQEKESAVFYKSRFTAFLTQDHANDQLRTHLAHIMLLPSGNYYDDQRELITALLDVLVLLAGELHLQFQRIGKTDFIEIASAAKNALGTQDEPTDLLLALDNRIQHLLVDEFQDTSKLQFELIEKLTCGWQNNDGRTLFLVGDPMQSIYRFRQAEVGLFIKAQTEGIGTLQLVALQLTANFRSDRKIVEWINASFSQLFPHTSNIGIGAIRYSPSHAIREYEAKTGVFFHPHSDEVQFQTTLLNQLNVKLNDNQQENIAILVRSRKHAKQIIPWLRACRIPYQAIDIETLELKPITHDLLALTKALIYLGDKTAWFAILRAPWCGLCLTDLLIISSYNPDQTLWETLQNAESVPELSEDGRIRLNRVIPILSHALAQSFRLPVRQWIEHTWLALGGAACLPVRSTLTDAASYFNLLSDFEWTNESFQLSELEHNLKKAYALSPLTEKARISIMTMHKAKGLEFDIVILPALESRTRPDDKNILVWMDQPRSHQADNDILLAMCQPAGMENDKLYNYIRRQEKEKALLEATRLLYVAATRAKKQLHCYFHLDDFEQPEKNNFLALLWPVIKQDIHFIPEKNEYPPPFIEKRNDNPNSINLHRLSSNFELPATIDLHLTEKNISSNEDVCFDWNKDNQIDRLIGTVLHNLFKAIAKQGVSNWNLLTQVEKNERIELLCQLGRIPVQNMASAKKKILNCLEKMFESVRGLWLFNQLSQPDSKVEFALSTFQYGEVKQFILDATFVDENNIRWIIDYKTADYFDSDLSLFLDEQKQLYLPQLEKYAELISKTEKRPIQLALYFPIINEWMEWKYVF